MKIETIFAAIMLTVIGLFVTFVVVRGGGVASASSGTASSPLAASSGSDSLWEAQLTGYDAADFCVCFDTGYDAGAKPIAYWEDHARKITSKVKADGTPMTAAEIDAAVAREARTMQAVAYQGGYQTCLERLGEEGANAWANAFNNAQARSGARRCPAYKQKVRAEERRLERAAKL